MQTQLIDSQTTVNEIVRIAPLALPVLRRFGIDACCGGALPLEEAARRHGVALEEVIAALIEVGYGAGAAA
jgi:iron-sulfur cluster repair protein YtfE (RIC family)